MTLTAASVRRMIPSRARNAHKGDNGHVLIVAGSRGMTGAANLSAMGCLYSGAGLVTVASIEEVRNVIRCRLPEAMTIGFSEIFSYLGRRKINALAIGPGLGIGSNQKNLVRNCLRLTLPTVLDADGLNVLAPKDFKKHPALVITPHPGELSKLMGISRGKIEQDRKAAAMHAAKTLGVVCVLKGHQTVISNGRETFINHTGNSAMATGGMGDVLTGVISSFLAQGLSPLQAACAGVYVHGLAGDLARVSDRGLLATELGMKIPHALKSIGLK